MPLKTDSLQAASVDNSTNTYLMPLWKAVATYNATGGRGRVAGLSKRYDAFRSTSKMPEAVGEQREQALALQDIMYQAAGFLTCKPPDATKHKRHARWDAMVDLMKQVNAEAARIGVKLVDSAADFRNVGKSESSVWLEVIDPKHREYGALSHKYEKWRNDPKAQTAKQSFWEYIKDYEVEGTVLYDNGAKFSAERGVDGAWKEIQGQNIDTLSSESIQSAGTNVGWGIFAVTTDQKLHVGDHSNNPQAWVRHTSLTSGEPILAAGEIGVREGKITAISNLTGHYKLGSPLFLDWVATTPLLSNDVLVKARVNILFPKGVHGDDKDAAPEMKVGAAEILAGTVGSIRKWIATGKAMSDFPFDIGPNEWPDFDIEAKDLTPLTANYPTGAKIEV
jgi:hypothetical protein